MNEKTISKIGLDLVRAISVKFLSYFYILDKSISCQNQADVTLYSFYQIANLRYFSWQVYSNIVILSRKGKKMPETHVVIYKEEDGTCPLLDWLDGLPSKAQYKCIVRIERLAEKGHELRRPEAAPLRDKIYELRTVLHGSQYRMLYFFYKKQCVITHGFNKKGSKDETRLPCFISAFFSLVFIFIA